MIKLLLFLSMAYVAVLAANSRSSEDEHQYAEIVLEGSCPTIKAVGNVKMDRVVGWYYQVYSSIDNPLCYKNRGQTLYGSQFDERTLSVQLCCQSASDPHVAYCGSKVGSGFVTATNTTGKFQYETGNNYNNLPVFILDTNYDDFSICYGCNQHAEMIYILSREYTLSDTLKARVRKVLKRNGIDFSKVQPVKQGPNIPYIPNSTPCKR